MADSTHILKLKATLDTSEVKQKLDQLRQAQKQALGNTQQAGNIAPNANLGGLTSTLNRLNTTMMQMLRTLQQLVGAKNNNNNFNNRNNIPYIPYGPLNNTTQHNAYQPNNINVARDFNDVVKELARGQVRSIRNARRFFGRGGQISLPTPLKYGLNTISHLTNNRSTLDNYPDVVRNEYTRYFDLVDENLRHPAKPLRNFNYNRLKMYDDATRRTYFKPYLSKSAYNLNNAVANNGFYSRNNLDPEMARTLRWGGGLAAHQVLGGVSQYFEATGNKTGSTLMGIGQYTAMGSMMGGLPGAAIGTAAGAVCAAFDKLTERAKALADAFEEQQNRVKEAKTVDAGLRDKMYTDTDVRRFKVGDVGYFKNRLAFKKGLLDKLTKQQEEVGLEPGSLTAYEEETQKKIEAFREGSPTGELPEEIRYRQRIANRYKANIGTIDTLKTQITGYEGNLDTLGVFSDKKQEALDFADKAKRNSTGRLNDIKNIIQGDLDAAEGRKNALYYRSEKTGTPVSLKALESIQEEIDGFKDKLKMLNSELDEREERRKASVLETAQTELQNLQDRLSNLKAPDMSNINSIAQYGFGISQKDDEIRIKMQTDYQKQQVDLTRQIKDKILKMNNGSIYTD